ncbi:MAG TPA: glycosyltransferase [Vicinamibacterales bacterium]|nr:glycosyltransferase [Vicinamibacterales bacterium]
MSTRSDGAPPLVAIDPPPEATDAPRVSVVMSAFNNAPHIVQAIESVLAQQLEARYEFIVADDCSSDGTTAILHGYKRRFPTLIRLALARQNTCGVDSFREAVRAASAEYIALIDGDDYWVSRDKLQKQVTFLDAHPACSMCFHNAIAYYEDESSEPFDFKPATTSGVLGQRDLLERNSVVSCAPMIRASVLQALPDWVFGLELADWAMYVMAAEWGAVGYLDEIMGAYRIHEAGSWSKVGRRGQLAGSIRFYEEMRDRLGPAHSELIERQRRVCCQELRTHAWTAWTTGDRPEALRAWADLAQHDPDTLSAEFAHRFGQQAQASVDREDGEPAYEGFQDAVNGAVVSGWAWDARRPDAPVSIEILDGDVVIATVRADTYRSDLLAAGKGRGYHAFACRLPESLRDGQPHRIHTRIAGARVPLSNSGTIVAFPDRGRSEQHAAMRSTEVKWLQQDIESARRTAEQLRRHLVARDQQVVELRRKLETTRSAIAGLQQEIGARNEEAQRLESALTEQQDAGRQVDRSTTKLSGTKQDLDAMKVSLGWRIGSPARSLVRWLTGRSRPH